MARVVDAGSGGKLARRARIGQLGLEVGSTFLYLFDYGDEHSVRLSGVPTAGYRWAPEVEGAGDVAEVSHAGTEVPSGGAVGGGAQERFTIRALQPGVTKVRSFASFTAAKKGMRANLVMAIRSQPDVCAIVSISSTPGSSG